MDIETRDLYEAFDLEAEFASQTHELIHNSSEFASQTHELIHNSSEFASQTHEQIGRADFSSEEASEADGVEVENGVGDSEASGESSGSVAGAENADEADSNEDSGDSYDDADIDVASKDENSKYAAARRKAEQQRDRALREQKDRHEKEMDAFVRELGLVIPSTGKAVKTRADYEVYRNEKLTADLKARLEDGEAGLSDVEKHVSERVENDPRVVEAERIIAQSRREKVRESINSDLEEIRKVNPDVSSLEDLKKLEKYDEISAMIRSGVPLGAAYFYVYRGEIAQSASADAKAESEALKASVQKKEQEINVLKSRDAKARSKGHLTSTVSRGTGAASVPKETLELYKSFMPGVSDDDIAKHYEKYLS